MFLPPSYPQSPAPTLGLYMEYSAFWDSSSWFLGLPLVPGYIYFIPLVPPTHLIPVSCLLVLLSPGCSAVGATSAPCEPLMAPCSSPPGPVCACMHVCTYALTPPPVSWACVCMHTTHYSPSFILSSSSPPNVCLLYCCVSIYIYLCIYIYISRSAFSSSYSSYSYSCVSTIVPRSLFPLLLLRCIFTIGYQYI